MIKMTFKPVTHVLFDMDGLLLNTEDLYTIGFQKIASRYGKEFTFSLKNKIMGQQSKEFARIIINELDLPLTPDEFLTETRKFFNDLFPQCRIMPAVPVASYACYTNYFKQVANESIDRYVIAIMCKQQRPAPYSFGVEKLIYHLHKNNIPMGLATSSSIESYELKACQHRKLFDLLPYKTWGTSDPQVKNGKPSPDIFFVAAAKFPDKPATEKCLVFEDSINGVKAARAAGMQVVMVPDPRLDRSLATEATIILNSMEDFQPELFGLPPFENNNI
ncbi:pseudouridine-5'-phosphatase-like isoform X1 [Galleria mellonella]|uniref:Pseudouridine-5'-phosphatase-like isoform X1 n=1 Tax=Galleria mellonella TaxID=7137 RepID=A0A6J3CFD4_GALME|nr:pseudouridine-5'-phosphatase-like isoform X1 [Galleria mellonella]